MSCASLLEHRTTSKKVSPFGPSHRDAAEMRLEEAHSLLLALSAAMDCQAGEGASALSDSIKGNALAGIASLVALAGFHFDRIDRGEER